MDFLESVLQPGRNLEVEEQMGSSPGGDRGSGLQAKAGGRIPDPFTPPLFLSLPYCPEEDQPERLGLYTRAHPGGALTVGESGSQETARPALQSKLHQPLASL